METEVMTEWRLMDIEVEQWGKVCREIEKLTGESVNEEKYKPLARSIDTWGQELARLRIHQRENGGIDITRQDGRVFGEG